MSPQRQRHRTTEQQIWSAETTTQPPSFASSTSTSAVTFQATHTAYDPSRTTSIALSSRERTLSVHSATSSSHSASSSLQRHTDGPSSSPRGSESRARVHTTLSSTISTAGLPRSSATATPRPSQATSGGPGLGQNRANAGLSSRDEKAVIAASVIGGVLILALLCLLLWQRRRRRRRVELTANRPGSTTTFLSVRTRDGNLTALPVRPQPRHLVDEEVPGIPAFPARVRDRLGRHNSSMQDLWKNANPPTPTSPAFPPLGAPRRYQSSTLRPPEMAEARTDSMARPIVRVSSYDSIHHSPAESIYAPSAIDLEQDAHLDTPPSYGFGAQDRGSWATSYATAKSRLDARSFASAMSALPVLRTMKGWVQNDTGEPSDTTTAATIFKNKATKPNLAPLPTRELSQRRFASAGSRAKNETGVHSEEMHFSES